jgi:hypothetical protein
MTSIPLEALSRKQGKLHKNSLNANIELGGLEVVYNLNSFKRKTTRPQGDVLVEQEGRSFTIHLLIPSSRVLLCQSLCQPLKIQRQEQAGETIPSWGLQGR